MDTLDDDDLTNEQMRVLQWLEDHPGTSLGVAAQALNLEVAEVEALCADLTAAGMIERAREQ